MTRAEARAVQALAWPDRWASDLKLEVDSHPFTLVGREFQQAILRDESKSIVVPKGAQLGLTTDFIVKAAHSIIQRHWSVLYLLPVKSGSVQFVQSRIDPVLDSNKTLSSEFSKTDNRVMKVTANGVAWRIRGTNIASELREAPADVLVIDERDVAIEENLDDAYARLDGSPVARIYELSTPTIDGHGVYGDDGWAASDQMQWWVACIHCGSKQVIEWEANVLPHLGDSVEESERSCRCTHCHKHWTDIDRALMNASGTWVPLNPGAKIRGYHLSQFNSPTKTLADPKLGMLVNWFKGQIDSRKLKAFYNLGLGLPYTALGDKFTVELLNRCRQDYSMGGIPESALYIGIDQGQEVLHVTMWTKRGNRRRLVRALLVRGDTKNGTERTKWRVLEEDVLGAYSNWLAVCDAHPDKEDCETLSKRYSGRFFMGFEKDRPEQEATAKFQEPKYGEPCKVNIDRSMALDSYIKLAIDGNLLLPRDAHEIGEYMPGKPYNGFYHQHLQMARVEYPDASGQRDLARWVNGNVNQAAAKKGVKQGNRPDHWHHSGMFGFIATMREAPLVIEPEVGALFAAAGGFIA